MNYLLIIQAKPMKNNKKFTLIGEAEFQAWVIADSIEAAQSRICSLLEQKKWMPTIENGYFITEEQMGNLEATEEKLFMEALKNKGISIRMISCARCLDEQRCL
ncbi:MAG: hypothetical protein J5979_06980 [Lachnospiraceae bacterium]|nr:hypothetical protein [Lachnospiraceae bacterium]